MTLRLRSGQALRLRSGQGPFTTLTRHFAGAILSPPILTELGGDFFRRTLFSILGAMLAFGWLLPNAFFRRYVDLSAAIWPDAYLRTLAADTVLMIAIPMLIIGITTVLFAPLLFPDETDYFVLTPLPITRARIFAAKLVAVTLVVFAAVLAVTALASLWFPLVAGGRFAPHRVTPRVLAHAVAALAGTLWMSGAMMAMQGLCLVAVPAAWQRRFAQVLQAGLFLLLLLSVPLVFRLPTARITSESILRPPLVWLPPVWFYGVERVLLEGQPTRWSATPSAAFQPPDRAAAYASAARIAGAASVIVVVAIAGAYFRLYRSAERLSGPPAASARARPGWRLLTRLERRHVLRSPTAAVMAFAASGLARSRLHQFVILVVAAAGLAILAGQVATVLEWSASASNGRSAHAAIAAPLVVALCSTLGLRMAFWLPLDREASWIFRITERVDHRAAALDGVVYFFAAGAIVLPAIAACALQWPVLGPAMASSLALTLGASMLLVEVVLAEWRRIPFTCSYLPGKRVLAYTAGVLLAWYAVFVYIGAQILRWSILRPWRTLVVGGLLIAAVVWMRRERLRIWGALPLEFEDEDPNAVRPLRLVPQDEERT